MSLEHSDPEIAKAIQQELERQQYNLELIASENIVSTAVLAAQATVLTNKYAEGYPKKRYYGGCEYMDVVEQLAIDRAKKLFSANFANVQPHSGSQANMAVYFAYLKPGDTVMGMDLAHGGHLTHGSSISFSGKYFHFVHYGVRKDTGTIDYNELAEMAQKHRPKMIVAGASAYPRIFDFSAFAKIAESIGAYFMVDMAHIAGLVSAGVHPSPIQFADIVTSTTHKTLRGPRGGLIVSKNESKDLHNKVNKEVFPGIQGGPLMHIIAAKAVAFKEADSEEFRVYQHQIVKNAKCMAQRLLANGINLVSGGTDNHLMLLDLSNLNITGEETEKALEKAGITANKNAVPFDTRGKNITSGIRIGTPTITSRGMRELESEYIADLIAQIIKDIKNNTLIEQTRRKVRELCESFPIYTGLKYYGSTE
ncbi:MAG: serine hydroxymethyltransferase [Desulfobacterales bacterium]|nr:serine hydroxymethyltransferase [Desulfobacterales bacterium]